MNEHDAIIDEIAKEVTKEILQEITDDPFWPNENNPNNPIFSDKSAQQLQALTKEWNRIIDQADKWFIEYAHPLFEQCQTMDDWKRVRMAMPKPTDKDGQILDLPGIMQLRLAYAADLVREKKARSRKDPA
jgi:hypothetical protein